MTAFFDLYDAIINDIKCSIPVESLYLGKFWAMAEIGGQVGIAMSTDSESIPPMLTNLDERISLKDAAHAIKSWNFHEASMMMAACNAYFNTPERLKTLGCFEPYANYCTAGLDLSGAKIGLVGHLSITEEMKAKAEKIYIIERNPQKGDYPDSACDYILPNCDIVLITGSAIINKTLPHLLDLCKNAYTILVGPTVPLCPALLEHGIDRIAGMVVKDNAAMRDKVLSGLAGSPYDAGIPFMLKK